MMMTINLYSAPYLQTLKRDETECLVEAPTLFGPVGIHQLLLCGRLSEWEDLPLCSHLKRISYFFTYNKI